MVAKIHHKVYLNALEEVKCRRNWNGQHWICAAHGPVDFPQLGFVCPSPPTGTGRIEIHPTNGYSVHPLLTGCGRKGDTHPDTSSSVIRIGKCSTWDPVSRNNWFLKHLCGRVAKCIGMQIFYELLLSMLQVWRSWWSTDSERSRTTDVPHVQHPHTQTHTTTWGRPSPPCHRKWSTFHLIRNPLLE